MELENLKGKVFTIKIIGSTENGQYFMGQTTQIEERIYIENTGDFFEEELIGNIEKCVIINVKKNHLIGFLLSNRKFINDMKKIKKKMEKEAIPGPLGDIYLLERLTINGEVIGLYLVEQGNRKIYFLGEEEIGVYTDLPREGQIIWKQNSIDNRLKEQIRDVIASIDVIKKEVSLREEQDKQKHIIEKELGIEQDRQITRIVTIDLEEKIKEKSKDTKTMHRQIQEKAIQQNIVKRETLKEDITIKQQLDINDKVTDMKNLGKLLEDENKLPKQEGKKFTKLGIIESDEKNQIQNQKGEKEKVNTTRYSFVAIASDGSVMPLDLEQDHAEGNNPRETNYQVEQNGRIQQDEVLSRFKIGNGTFAIKNGQYGEIKVYHSPEKTIGGKDIEGNKSLDRELETDNVWEIKKEERDLAGEYKTGYRQVERSYQEAKIHEDEKGKIKQQDKLEIEDIDGDKNTKSHVHDQVNYQELAVKWGYYKEGLPNAQRAQELLEEKRKQNPTKDTKAIIEMIEEDLEEQIQPGNRAR